MSNDEATTESVRHARTLVGKTLKDKWRLEALVGVGGMASVYAATHRNGDRVAVKILHPMYAVQPSVRTRFLREGYAANAVGHPGAVNVRDDETDGDHVFLVMELLTGETLDERWERHGVLPLGEVCTIAEQMLDVLAAAHDKGIWHRDIKPANVFLTNDGRVKVLDFGIAKVRDASGSADAPSVTQTGAMVGTPAFMSPEQVLASPKQIDAQSDIWSVGATLFALITGRYVHQGTTPNELLVKTATEPAPPLKSILPDVPDSIAAVVDRALLRDKNQRWPDARSMLRALQAARESLGLAAGFVATSVSAEHRHRAAFAPTVGSDPVGGQSAPETPTLLGNLTTAHAHSDSASSVSVPVPTAPSARKSRSRLIAAALGVTLVTGIGLGVMIVVRTGQTAPAAAASASEIAPPESTISPAVVAPNEPQVKPADTPAPIATVDAGSARDRAAAPVRTPSVSVKKSEPKSAEPKPTQPAASPAETKPKVDWERR